MKKFIIAIGLLSLVFLGAQKSIQSGRFEQAILANSSYANSQVDTIRYVRKDGLADLAFGAHFQDSVNVSSIVVRRMVGGELMGGLTTDTLTNFTNFTNTSAGLLGSTANPSSAKTNTVTIAPLPDVYVFVVTYASSANGTTNGKVDYIVEQNYRK